MLKIVLIYGKIFQSTEIEIWCQKLDFIILCAVSCCSSWENGKLSKKKV